ncbi:MAG: putative cell division FtsK/SpoIIIE [Parcubacteria group bacterium Gr01-1014_8]|nr:MAG: putative cell division FtsK/SpoIIIE [Parcubacteria group bacterium Gr01-1014_8]
MARNGTKKNGKRERKEKDETEYRPSISSEALRGVGAVLLIATAVFLVLAAFDIGGTVGEQLFKALTWLLGIGYMLFPLSLLILAVAILRSFEKSFGVVQIGSVVVFLLASLGLINIGFPGRSGLLGSLISKPLIATVDTAATIVFLLAFIIAALIVAFDIHLGLIVKGLRERLKSEPSDAGIGEEDDVAIAEMQGMDEEATEEVEEEVAPDSEPQLMKPEREEITSPGGFPIIAATYSEYIPPPLSLLGKNKGKPEVGDVKANMNIIKRTLQNFGIQVEMDEVSIGPTVTRYAMKPAEGVRLSKIVALQSNLELALAASPVRIEAPIPGKSLVGIEVPNISRTTLGLAPLLGDPQFSQSDKPLLVGLGRSISGGAHFADLSRMPHMLVAGATGAGKSVAIHDFIISLLYRCGPERLRFIMVDPKRVELTMYNTIPHLLTPVITDARKAIEAIKWLAKEMERRYNILETEKVRDIASYHENVFGPALKEARAKEAEGALPEAMPYIVVIIDELADIMSSYPRELEAGIVRLAQMSRAVGIHLILSTQRPSVKVITGLIKANIPARVALQVSSQIDSRTILDTGGAEKLLGAGDMLFISGEMSKPRRLQAPFTSESEVKRVVAYIARTNEGTMPSEINFTDKQANGGGTDPIFASMSDENEDDLYPEAKRAVLEAGKASTSYLQRKLGVGYARAARMIDTLEERGVIGPGDGAKPREVIGAGNADELAAEPENGDSEEEKV